GYERGHAVEPPERDAYGRADMADHHDGVRTAVRQPERGVVVSGELDSVKSGRNRPAERSAVEAEREDLGRDVPGRQQRTFSGAAEGDGRRQDAELDGRERAVEAERAETGEGVSADDRAGKTVAERIRA
ncbi:nuclease, partial [Klebsiella pneumoniae]|nr:nuclease [Klebsiella pneumoniae]